MKSNAVVSAILALSLTAGGFAFGQGYGGRNDQPQRGDPRGDQRGDQRDRGDNRGRQYGRDRNDQWRSERGAGPSHQFHRGDRLPPEYRHRQYVVDDWRGHRLQAPPRGYHWVQSGGDYLLVAIATGVILQLLLNN